MEAAAALKTSASCSARVWNLHLHQATSGYMCSLVERLGHTYVQKRVHDEQHRNCEGTLLSVCTLDT